MYVRDKDFVPYYKRAINLYNRESGDIGNANTAYVEMNTAGLTYHEINIPVLTNTTITVEAYNGVNAAGTEQWVDVTNDWFGASTFTATGRLAKAGVSAYRIRVKAVTTNATNTLIVDYYGARAY